MADDELQEAAENYSKTQEIRAAVNLEADEETYKEKLLSFDKFVTQFRKSLLGYQIHYKMFEVEGRLEQWEFVRTTEGKWVPYHQLDADEKERLRKQGLCNQQGVQVIMSFLNSVVNDVVAASNLDRKKSYKVGFQLSTSLTDQLLENMDKYDIDSYNDLDLILSMTDAVIAGILGKAEDQTLLDVLSKVMKVSEIKTDDGDDKSRLSGVFS